MNTTITQLQSNSDGLFSTAFLMFPSSVSSDDQEIWQRWSVERNHSVLAHVCFFVCFCLKQKKNNFLIQLNWFTPRWVITDYGRDFCVA